MVVIFSKTFAFARIIHIESTTNNFLFLFFPLICQMAKISNIQFLKNAKCRQEIWAVVNLNCCKLFVYSRLLLWFTIFRLWENFVFGLSFHLWFVSYETDFGLFWKEIITRIKPKWFPSNYFTKFEFTSRFWT